jgi:plasmid maintenance system antidote protein VapI
MRSSHPWVQRTCTHAPPDGLEVFCVVALGVPSRRINEVVRGKRRITADTARCPALYFGTTDRFWLNLQTRYDLEIEKDHLGPSLEGIRPLAEANAGPPAA